MSRPDIGNVIGELTPKHRTRRWVLLAALLALVIGAGIVYMVVPREPVDPALLISDAKLLIGKDAYAEAVPKLEAAYEHEPSTEAAQLLALCLDSQQLVEQDVGWQRRAVESEPTHTMLRQQLAMLLEKAGKTQEALAEWQTHNAQKPNDAYIQSKLKELGPEH